VKLKALITDMRHASAAEEERVFAAAGIPVDTTFSDSEDALIRNGKGAVGFLVSYAKVTRRVMEALPDLKIIVKYGIGVDTIDLAAASDLGKYVANIPDYCTEEVALHALALILDGVRMTGPLGRQVAAGQWKDSPEGTVVLRPSTAKLGLVGYGRIARKLEDLAASIFGGTVFFDPFVDDAALAGRKAQRARSVGELFTQCAVVSVHAPLADGTRGMIDSTAVGRGKGVVLVNTSRGGVVDRDAVVRGLADGALAYFGADVFWSEPPDYTDPVTAELLRDPRVLITPHVAWCSDASAREVRRRAAEEVVRVARGELPQNLVNKDVLKRKG
jgi:D-3-phosphoglycerate dehydrogenase / 2-oxoglutarate reductase